MLAIKKSETPSANVVPNVLPCRIQHNGPVNASTRHWTPETSADTKSSTAYFRGRKLNGAVVKLPDGYKGAILEKTNDVLAPTVSPSTQPDQEQEAPEETKVMRQVASFDEIVVWGHEMQPDGQEDVYLRGVNEWIGLATAMNSF